MTDTNLDKDIVKMLYNIVAQQALILASYNGSKEAYFKAKGLGSLPVDSQARAAKAFEFLNKSPADYDSMFVLFDSVQDRRNGWWYYTLGAKYSQNPHSNPHYNEQESINYTFAAAKLGHYQAQISLGDTCLYGHFNVLKNLDQALYWYNQSFQKKTTANIADIIARIQMKKSGVDSVFETQSLPPEVVEYILKAAELDKDNIQYGTTKMAAASLLAQGLGVERNEALAAQYYNDLIQNPSGNSFLALRALAIRRAFGLGIPHDVERARKLLADHQEMRCGCQGYYEPLEEFLKYADSPGFQGTIQYIKERYKLERTPLNILSQINEGRVKPTHGLFLVLNAVKILATTENWKNVNEWRNVTSHLKLIYHGFDPDKLNSDTWRLGPFYNAVSENGMPILGDIREEHFGTPGFYDGEPIEPGISKFKGLTATSSGDLELHFGESENEPAYLLKEDVDTALVLAFGYQEFQWPKIDIQMYPTNYGDGLAEAQHKGIKPEWLIETPIGSTFYIADMLGGRLSWSINEFEIANDCLGEKASDLLDKIKAIKAPSPANNSGRVINVNPVGVKRAINDNIDFSGATVWDINIGKVFMRISGGYSIHDTDGEVKEWQFRDDPTYEHGKICNTLTENFDTIAKVLPVYERLRQFTGMIYALKDLRGKGFRPNAKLQAEIDHKTAEFEKRIEGKSPEYARSLPLFERKPEIGC